MKQLDLFTNRGYGGKRKNAGRPRKDKSLQLHLSRPEFKPNQPLHITVRLVHGLPSLRHSRYYRHFKQAALKAKRKGLRIIHFSVQGNHIHLLVESETKGALSRAMQSFCTSLARSLNENLKRRGRVFRDRYHMHILRTAREVKNALIYIFQNLAKHTRQPNRFDPRSTLICFAERPALGLARVSVEKYFSSPQLREAHKNELLSVLSAPLHWLLTTGWKRALLEI